MSQRMKLIGDLERVVRGKCGDLGGVVAEMTLLVCPRSISQSSICIVEYGVEYCKNIIVAPFYYIPTPNQIYISH